MDGPSKEHYIGQRDCVYEREMLIEFCTAWNIRTEVQAKAENSTTPDADGYHNYD